MILDRRQALIGASTTLISTVAAKAGFDGSSYIEPKVIIQPLFNYDVPRWQILSEKGDKETRLNLFTDDKQAYVSASLIRQKSFHYAPEFVIAAKNINHIVDMLKKTAATVCNHIKEIDDKDYKVYITYRVSPSKTMYFSKREGQCWSIFSIIASFEELKFAPFTDTTANYDVSQQIS